MFDELPPPPETRTAQVEESRIRDEARVLLCADARVATGSKGASGPSVNDVSCVEQMNLPEGWVAERPQQRPFGMKTHMEFHPADDNSITISMRYGGTELDKRSQEAISAVFAAPEHQLTRRELDSLRGALGNVGDNNPTDPTRAFNLTAARTEEVNGKKVLRIEGNWTTGQKLEFTGIFVPCDKKLDEIYLEAPKAVAETHKSAYEAMLKKINWK